MKLLLLVSIAMFVVVFTSFAQQPVAIPDGLPAKPDTPAYLYHADQVTFTDSLERRHLICEGNVEATIFQYHIKADRLEIFSDPLHVIATSNVVVMVYSEPIHAKRFEWKRNEPDSPIFVTD